MSKVVVVQPSVPEYRIPFFQKLYEALDGDLLVFHGRILGGGIERNSMESVAWSRDFCTVIKIPFVTLFWQKAIVGLHLKREDWLVVAGNCRFLSTILLCVKAKFLGIRVVWWSHWNLAQKKNLLDASAKKFFLWLIQPTVILVYTEFEASQLSTVMQSRYKPLIAGLNNGLDISSINRSQNPHSSQSFGRTRLLFIGRITEKANFELLINAVAEAKTANLVVDVIGDGPLAVRMVELSEHLCVKESFEWHGSVTCENRIAAIARGCDGFVYPGNVGLSLIHGFAYGLPAIVHNDQTMHMPEIAAFCEFVNGFTFTQGDSGSLASAIDRFFSLSRDELVKFRLAAFATVQDTYNVDDMVQRFCDCLGKDLSVSSSV